MEDGWWKKPWSEHRKHGLLRAEMTTYASGYREVSVTYRDHYNRYIKLRTAQRVAWVDEYMAKHGLALDGRPFEVAYSSGPATKQRWDATNWKPVFNYPGNGRGRERGHGLRKRI